MELKVACGCGQNYAFDVEPVDGRMPMRVNCPACGTDGTGTANDLLSQQFPGQQSAPPVAASVQPPPGAGGLRINTAPSPFASTPATPPPLNAPRPIAPLLKPKAASKDFSLGLGILGAIIGAVVGGGLMFAFFALVGFRFPITGVIIGICTGYGARLLGRGTDTTLGYVAGAIALATILAVFFLMYGGIPGLSFISIIICVYGAYRLSSE
ncbi:MAG TPA: hypothetical protein VGN23_07365 [Verrucomicrobiae bacterium]|jgi:hypothetical protein